MQIGKKSKQNQKYPFTENKESVLCLPTTLRHSVFPGDWAKCLVMFHWRKRIFPLPGSIKASSLLDKSRTLWPLPVFDAGVLSGLLLCRSCVHGSMLWVLCITTIVSGRQFPWSHPPSLAFKGRDSSSCLSFHIDPGGWRGGVCCSHPI